MSELRMPMTTRRMAGPVNWVPVFFGLTVIWMESTVTMGAANTSRWLLELCHALWGQTDTASFEMAHAFLRKMGHFSGYGILSLLFYRAWYVTVGFFWKGTRSGLRLEAGGLAVFCTFLVASMDEWHQSFLEGRKSSVYDVLIDTCGALVFTAVVMLVVRRRGLMEMVERG